MIERLLEVAGPTESYTLEVRPSNPAAIALYERFGFVRGRDPAEVLRGHRGGRVDHVANRGGQRRLAVAGGRMILALETSCDDTCAAVITPRRRILSNVISSQGIHARYGGVVPEIASRHHLELIGAVVDDALARADTPLELIELIGVTRGPGLVAALLVGVATRQGAGGRAPDAARAGRPSPRPRRRELPRPWERIRAARAAVPEPGRERRPHAAGARARPRPRVRGARPDARRRGRRGVRQGRPAARARYPGGPALERLARDGDPEAFDFPTAARMSGLDFSFAGLKTALLYRVRELGEEEAERSPR